MGNGGCKAVKTPENVATFGMGWFWGPDIRFANQRDEKALSEGNIKGIIKTRVGYCGGKKSNPNYGAIKDYAEAIQIWYDGTIETYNDLLRQFFEEYDPKYATKFGQYRWVIWYSNEEQKTAITNYVAENKRAKLPPLEQLGDFYLAEAYHQKFNSDEMYDERINSKKDFGRSERDKLMMGKYKSMWDFKTITYNLEIEDTDKDKDNNNKDDNDSGNKTEKNTT